MCSTAYVNFEVAAATVNMLNARIGGAWEASPCSKCGRWHVSRAARPVNAPKRREIALRPPVRQRYGVKTVGMRR